MGAGLFPQAGGTKPKKYAMYCHVQKERNSWKKIEPPSTVMITVPEAKMGMISCTCERTGGGGDGCGGGGGAGGVGGVGGVGSGGSGGGRRDVCGASCIEAYAVDARGSFPPALILPRTSKYMRPLFTQMICSGMAASVAHPMR